VLSGAIWNWDQFDDSCVHELRNSLPPQLERFEVDIPSIEWAAKCLAPPHPHAHPLRWTSLGNYHSRLQFSDATVALFPLAVPMLTNLRGSFDTITDFSFLHRLPRLQSLMMDLQRRALWPGALQALTNPPADASFANLTEFNLRDARRTTVEDLEAVLRQVPRLTSLDLMGINRAKSLRFLSSAPHLRSKLTYLGHRRRPARMDGAGARFLRLHRFTPRVDAPLTVERDGLASSACQAYQEAGDARVGRGGRGTGRRGGG
jgi:hypothetical protein